MTEEVSLYCRWNPTYEARTKPAVELEAAQLGHTDKQASQLRQWVLQ